jgi:hypothetical protein
MVNDVKALEKMGSQATGRFLECSQAVLMEILSGHTDLDLPDLDSAGRCAERSGEICWVVIP